MSQENRTNEAVIAKPARDPWLDIFRGVAILLVVAGHVIGGLTYTSHITSVRGFREAYDWIYAFHMPAFFVAAGLVMDKSLRTRGPWQFLLEKFRTLMYPYLVWGVLSQAVSRLAQGYVNSAYDPNRLVRMLYDPGAGMWFLYVLFLLCMAYALMWRLPRRPIVFTVITSLAYLGFVFAGESLPPGIHQFCHYGIYLSLGLLTSPKPLDYARKWPIWLLSCVTFLGFGLLTTLRLGEISDPSAGFFSAICGIFGLFGFSALISRLGPAWGRSFVALCGERSLEIYLVHPFTSVPLRIVAHRAFGVTDAPIHLVICVVGGVLGSLLFAFVARLTPLKYLFRI